MTRYSWCGHMPPRARISEPWLRHGSDEAALRIIVVRLWRQYMEIHGLSPAEVPWVLPDLPEAEASVGGAASSSA